MSDVSLLFAWRNEPSTYQQFLHAALVSWDEHVAWLQGVLVDPDRRLFVAEVGGLPVGAVRLDRIDDRCVEISVTVAEKHRGHGYGTAIIREATKWAKESGFGTYIKALVKAGNFASLLSFQKAGYKVRSQTEEEVILTCEFLL